VVAHSFGVLCASLALRTGLTASRLVAISGVTDFDYLVKAFARRAGLSPRAARALRRRIERVIEAEGLTWEQMTGAAGVPTLVIHDTQDRMIPHSHAVAIAGAGRLITTEGLGHHRILADPGVITAVTSFLTVPDETVPEEQSAAAA
jgi:pimeloyl-ACP methyl ester carboxylesterase